MFSVTLQKRLAVNLHRLKWIAVGFAFAWCWMSKMG